MATYESVAVIGHGRSPEGRHWGALIDRCDVVVRMWDWGWQDREDYGERYDIGMLEAHPSYMLQWRRHNQHEPEVGWVASIVDHNVLSRCTTPVPTELFDQMPWVKYGQSIGGIGMTGRLRYTRGTLAALWTITRADARQVILVGFDSIQKRHAEPTQEAFSPTYLQNPGTFSFSHYSKTVAEDGTTTKHGNHDYAVERPVLEHYAAEHGVELLWANDVWE